MSKGFTLVELLVVMGIMGLLGTVSVGGYRAMQRGMEERGVMQSVNSFVRAAYQRAQIDRQPAAIYFWNETVRSSTDDENEIVVGKAVAVRRYGRFSAVRNNMLIDEFADLDLTYQTAADEEGSGGSSSQESLLYIYPMEQLSDVQSGGALRRTSVEGKVRKANESVRFLVKADGDALDNEQNAREIPAYGFVIKNAGGVSWQPGMAYGMEFLQLELPHNYIFGSDFSSSTDNPVRGAGTIVFQVGVGTGNGLITGGTFGRNTITVHSLRPDNGTLKAVKVADSDNPEKALL